MKAEASDGSDSEVESIEKPSLFTVEARIKIMLQRLAIERACVPSTMVVLDNTKSLL